MALQLPIANGASFATQAPPSWQLDGLRDLVVATEERRRLEEERAIRLAEQRRQEMAAAAEALRRERVAENQDIRQLEQAKALSGLEAGQKVEENRQAMARMEKDYELRRGLAGFEASLKPKEQTVPFMADETGEDAIDPDFNAPLPDALSDLDVQTPSATILAPRVDGLGDLPDPSTTGEGLIQAGGPDLFGAPTPSPAQNSGPQVNAIPLKGLPGHFWVPNPDGKSGRVVKSESTTAMAPGTSPMTELPKEQAGMPISRVTVDEKGKRSAEYTPVDPKDIASQEKTVNQAKSEIAKAQLVSDDIDKIIGLAESSGLPAAGKLSEYIAKLPVATDADTIRRMINSVTADVAFSTLAEMRANSPTGGALGAVSEKELALLSSAAGSIDPALPKETFVENLRRLKDLRQAILQKWQQSLNKNPSVASATGTPDLETRAQEILAQRKQIPQNSPAYQNLLNEYRQIRAQQAAGRKTAPTPALDLDTSYRIPTNP